MTMVDHGECCMFKGHHYNIGHKIPIPEKCAWLECRFNIKFNPSSNIINKYLFSMSSIEDMGNMASLDLISEYNGCNCCLVANDTMIEDGLRYMICEQDNVMCFLI